MKKLLLLLSIITFVGLSSCSKDEVIEISQEEKELLIKQTLIELHKSAVKTGDFEQFMKSLSEKTSAKTLNDSEVEALFQKFLGDQSKAFLDLYYQLEAIGMTGEEFLEIADQFEYLFINKGNDIQKSSDSEGCGNPLSCALLEWLKEFRSSELANDDVVK